MIEYCKDNTKNEIETGQLFWLWRFGVYSLDGAGLTLRYCYYIKPLVNRCTITVSLPAMCVVSYYTVTLSIEDSHFGLWDSLHQSINHIRAFEETECFARDSKPSNYTTNGTTVRRSIHCSIPSPMTRTKIRYTYWYLACPFVKYYMHSPILVVWLFS